MMLVRLLAKRAGANDYELVDILRALSRYNRETVIGRSWRVSDLELWAYADTLNENADLKKLFPELGDADSLVAAVVSGERLIERAAVIHQFECGLFLRVVDASLSVILEPGYRLWRGPQEFQATNVDLEIRCGEAPYEIITEDKTLADYLQSVFSETELEI